MIVNARWAKITLLVVVLGCLGIGYYALTGRPLKYGLSSFNPKEGWSPTEAYTQWVIEHTNVSDVRDEPLRSIRGNLVGVRLSFSIDVPVDDYYSLSASLVPAQEFYARARQKISRPSYTNTHFLLRPTPQSVFVTAQDEPIISLLLKNGEHYDVVIDLFPSYLWQLAAVAYSEDGVALESTVGPGSVTAPVAKLAALDDIIRVDVETRYQLFFASGNIGRADFGENEHFTSRRYNPRRFYQGIRAELTTAR